MFQTIQIQSFCLALGRERKANISIRGAANSTALLRLQLFAYRASGYTRADDLPLPELKFSIHDR